MSARRLWRTCQRMKTQPSACRNGLRSGYGACNAIVFAADISSDARPLRACRVRTTLLRIAGSTSSILDRGSAGKGRAIAAASGLLLARVGMVGQPWTFRSCRGLRRVGCVVAKTSTRDHRFGLSLGLAAHAAEKVYKFTLPSKVDVRIVQSSINGRTHPNCIEIRRLPVFDDGILKACVKPITGTFEGRAFSLDTACIYDAWNGRPLEVPEVVR